MAEKTFRAILQDWKDKTGWSEQKIADQLGVSRAAVNQWLNTKAQPGIENLPALGRLLGRDWRELAAVILGEEVSKDRPMRPDISELLLKVSTLTPAEVGRISDVIDAMHPEVKPNNK